MRFVRTLAVLLLAVPAFAGGFYTELDLPTKQALERAPDAVLLARLVGCHQAEKGTIRATAIGTLDGKQTSIPVRLVALPAPGAYAITQSWPDRGAWVLKLEGSHPAFPQGNSTLVKVSGRTVDHANAKFSMKPATASEVAAFLGTK